MANKGLGIIGDAMNTGNFPKAMQGVKADKKADAKMSPKQLKSDIKTDKKLLAKAVKKKK